MAVGIVGVSQAVCQLGSVLGVVLTVLLVEHAGVTKADFNSLYGLLVALAVMTGLSCLAVNTRPISRGA